MSRRDFTPECLLGAKRGILTFLANTNMGITRFNAIEGQLGQTFIYELMNAATIGARYKVTLGDFADLSTNIYRCPNRFAVTQALNEMTISGDIEKKESGAGVSYRITKLGRETLAAMNTQINAVSPANEVSSVTSFRQ